ncbi:MAG: DMT family transporter [Mariprofundaceae bacterium]|nr:DMT family transporter [Mariprofundaceae bacterium]
MTAFALIAFAANSVFCRLALADGNMDATTFTVVRLLSAAVVLSIIGLHQQGRTVLAYGSWQAAACLFVYAAAFSYAYVSLATATGALILFAAVQFTMIAVAIWRGQHVQRWEWAGLLLAATGFVWLTLPSASAPSLAGLLLMSISGVAWGAYTLLGHQSTHAVLDTAGNFIRTIPAVVILAVLTLPSMHWSHAALGWAIASGTLASAIGYVLWYQALRHLSTPRAAVLQLLVPVIAAAGGVMIGELITVDLMIASSLILGGVWLVIAAR